MKLTTKQMAALQEANSSGSGRIFQLPERRKHSPQVLAALVRGGLLKGESVGVYWTITDEGRAALSNSAKA